MPMNPRTLRPRRRLAGSLSLLTQEGERLLTEADEELATEGGAFDPRSISDIALWLDGSDQSSMTLSGTSVSEWRDKSGKSNHAAQTTANNRPTLTANAIQGRSAITFSGSPIELTTSLTLAAPYSVIAVVKENARHIGAYIGPSTSSNLGFGDVFINLTDYNAGKWSAWGSNRAVYGNENANVTQSATILSNIISGSSFPGDISIFANGLGGIVTSQFASTPPGSSVDSVRIGRRGDSIEFWNGLIAEVIVYTRSITSVERLYIERGLSRKWGIAVA